MYSKSFLSFLLFIFLFQACSSTKQSTTTKPMEFYDPDAQTNASLLHLPIKLHKAELEKTINEQIGETIYEDGDFSDGLVIKATKQADITLHVSDHKVSYKVPINLWVKKNVVLTNVNAEGSLDLEFETAYDVKPDWHLETQTMLKNFEWTKAPIVKLGFGNLNVKSIANQFIEQAANQLTSSIDNQIKDLIDLKREVEKAWQELQKPIMVSEEFKTWLLMNTDSVKLTPLQTVNDIIESTVIITARPRMNIGEKPSIMENLPIPNFSYAENITSKNFNLYLGSEIPFAEAERIARDNMVGETYTYGRRKVKVEAVELSDQGNKLAVKTTLSGSYTGMVTLIGRPEYHDRKNEIVLKDVDFDFSEKRTLMKTASWLFKSPLKKTIEENLNFHLNENLLSAQKAIENELEKFELGPGINIIGNLEELNVSHVYINTTGINVKVGLTGEMALEVRSFMARK